MALASSIEIYGSSAHFSAATFLHSAKRLRIKASELEATYWFVLIVLSECGDQTSVRNAETQTSSCTTVVMCFEEVSAFHDILIEDPAYCDLSHKSFADVLNKRGIVTPRNLQWNEGNIVRMHKKAKAIVREREQLERELDAEDALQATISNTIPACTMISQKVHTLEPLVAKDTTADDEDDADFYKDDPLYGMF